MASTKPAAKRRTRNVEKPGNPDQVSEAKQVEQQSNMEALEDAELAANVRYVSAVEPPIGTVQGNFVLTANGWAQHAERTLAEVVERETEIEKEEGDDESNDGNDYDDDENDGQD